MRALCFGSLNRDHTYRLHHFLRPGETNHALSYDVLAGGKGLNQALSLARAGAETFMGGCIGEDGLSLQTFLQNNGVDTQYLKKVEAPTGHAIIQVEDSGENCILVYPGANYALTEEQIEETLGQFAAGDLLLVQNETNLVGMLLQKAKERRMITALNPSPISETLREEIEALLAKGGAPTSPKDIGISKELFHNSLLKGYTVRPRYSIMQFAKDNGRLEEIADKITEEIYG